MGQSDPLKGYLFLTAEHAKKIEAAAREDMVSELFLPKIIASQDSWRLILFIEALAYWREYQKINVRV